MEKINGKWMHDGKEYEVISGGCRKCCFDSLLKCGAGFSNHCLTILGINTGFKLKEKNMIKPFKCAAMTPDRVVKMRKALSRHGIEIRVGDDAVYVFYRPGEDMEWASYALTPEKFVDCEEEEMTFDQAMKMILAAPVLVPAPKFEFKPFDQILRQNKHSETWKIGFYSHIEPNNFIGLNGATVMRMLPYKGNEHLLNTKGRPDGWWEVENGKPVWRAK